MGLAPVPVQKDWGKASYEDKLGEIIFRAIPLVPGEIGSALQEMVKPENLAVMGAMFAGFVALQATPIGWIADLAIIGYSAWMIGSGITEIIKALVALNSDIKNARCDADIDAAAKRLAKGFVTSTGEVAGGLAGVWGVKSSGGITRIADGIKTLIEYGKKNFSGKPPPTVVIKGPAGETPSAPPLLKGLGGTVDQVETGVQWGKGNMAQGDPWEAFVQKKLGPTYERTPGPFKVIDHWNATTRTAASSKTMDTLTDSKLSKPGQIEGLVKGYVNDLVNFVGDTKKGLTITSEMIKVRELQLAIPAGTTAEQWAAINRALEYAKSQNLKVVITVIKP